MNTAVSGVPLVLLRVEGLVVLMTGGIACRALGGSWLLFAVLFLLPDVSMAGYLGGPRTGAAAYNVVHSYMASAVLAGLMAIGVVPAHWAICVIWVSHIGFERALGYGLEFSSAFRDTHLGVLSVSGT